MISNADGTSCNDKQLKTAEGIRGVNVKVADALLREYANVIMRECANKR